MRKVFISLLVLFFLITGYLYFFFGGKQYLSAIFRNGYGNFELKMSTVRNNKLFFGDDKRGSGIYSGKISYFGKNYILYWSNMRLKSHRIVDGDVLVYKDFCAESNTKEVVFYGKNKSEWYDLIQVGDYMTYSKNPFSASLTEEMSYSEIIGYKIMPVLSSNKPLTCEILK